MFDDEGNYTVLPDPDTLPEPHFEGLAWEQIKGELDRLEQEAWTDQLYAYEYEQWLHENSGWFKDF